VPEDWIYILERNELEINRSTGSELISLQGTSIPATPVKFFFEPRDARPGIYNIILAANNRPETDGIKITQGRVFNLTVNINGGIIDTKDTIRGSATTTVENPNQPMETTEEVPYYWILIVLIVFISFIIYRYS
jgi:hypothetical protein